MADRKDNVSKLYMGALYWVIIYSILCIALFCLFSFWFNASIVGIFISMIMSFAIYNAYASFPRVYLSNIVKYIAVHTPDLIFQIFVVFLLYHGFRWNKFLAYALAAVLVMLVAYLMVKKLLRNNDSYYELDFHDDSWTFIEWINEHQILANIGVFVLMAVFFPISNWFLLLVENLIKWDI